MEQVIKSNKICLLNLDIKLSYRLKDFKNSDHKIHTEKKTILFVIVSVIVFHTTVRKRVELDNQQ